MGIGLGIIVKDEKGRFQIELSATDCRIDNKGYRALFVPDRRSSVKEKDVVEIIKVTHYIPGRYEEDRDEKNGIFFVACRKLNDQQLLAVASLYPEGLKDERMLVDVDPIGNPVVRPVKTLIGQSNLWSRLHTVIMGKDQTVDLSLVTFYHCIGSNELPDLDFVETEGERFEAEKGCIKTSGVKILRDTVDEKRRKEEEELARELAIEEALEEAEAKQRDEKLLATFMAEHPEAKGWFQEKPTWYLVRNEAAKRKIACFVRTEKTGHYASFSKEMDFYDNIWELTVGGQSIQFVAGGGIEYEHGED